MAAALQASDLSIEVALLLEVRGHPGCGSVRLERGSRVASPHEEVAADRVEATIGADPRVGTKTLDQLEAGPGPATMLTATAWLGATTGLSSKRSRTSQRAAIWGQSVALGALRLIVEGGDSLCVPKTSSTSCDQTVFVDQASGAGLPSDAVLVEIDRYRQGFQRRSGVQ